MTKFFTSCILVFSLISVNAFASGGSYTGTKNNYYQDKYDLGKRVFETKLLCAGCPLEGTEISASNFDTIAPKLKKGGELDEVLSKKERKAAKYYLKKRLNSY